MTKIPAGRTGLRITTDGIQPRGLKNRLAYRGKLSLNLYTVGWDHLGYSMLQPLGADFQWSSMGSGQETRGHLDLAEDPEKYPGLELWVTAFRSEEDHPGYNAYSRMFLKDVRLEMSHPQDGPLGVIQAGDLGGGPFFQMALFTHSLSGWAVKERSRQARTMETLWGVNRCTRM